MRGEAAKEIYGPRYAFARPQPNGSVPWLGVWLGTFGFLQLCAGQVLARIEEVHVVLVFCIASIEDAPVGLVSCPLFLVPMATQDLHGGCLGVVFYFRLAMDGAHVKYYEGVL